MSEILTGVQLQSYYEDLSKKEKSKLLRYLISTFDYSSQSIQQKLTGRAELNKRDLFVINSVVSSELWRE